MAKEYLDYNGLSHFKDKLDLTYADKSHTHDTYEADLKWGGKNFSGSYGCIDAAMVDELGANRFMFAKAAGITVEYTRDGGTTWEDYGLTNAQKVGLFSSGTTTIIGKANTTDKATENGNLYQLRVTIDTGAAMIYTMLNKFILYVSTNGSANSVVTIQRATQSTPDNFIDVVADVPISGWSGYNVVNTPDFTTYGNSASQNKRVRFIFKANGGNTKYIGLTVYKIMGFGGVGWTTPSTMAKTGHLYSFDADQNATFPAKVTATGDITSSGNVTAKKFIGGLSVYPSARPVSANTCYGDGLLRYYLATSKMTTGKPPSDAMILHIGWDNTGGWDSQLAIGTGGNNKLYYRNMNGGSTWNAWKTVVTTDDLSTVATSGSYADLSNKPTIPEADTAITNAEIDAIVNGTSS